jgi:hypothetical protein
MSTNKDYLVISQNLEKEIQEAGLVISEIGFTNFHILEITLPDKQTYEDVLSYLKMECPTEVSCLYGMKKDYKVVLQFDRLD